MADFLVWVGCGCERVWMGRDQRGCGCICGWLDEPVDRWNLVLGWDGIGSTCRWLDESLDRWTPVYMVDYHRKL